jgi:2'-5' RNA ligase
MAAPRLDESIRAFVAVELSPEVTGVLQGLVQALRQEGLPSLRLVRPEGVHLTLKFLGEVPALLTEKIAVALDQAVTGVSPFQTQLHGLGGFPSLEAPRVLWVGLGDDLAPLQSLFRAVEGALRPLGLPAEERPFTPHLTLARLRDGTPPQERRRAGEALRRLAGQEQAPLRVEGVSLMRSVLRPEGAVYTRLHRAALREVPRISP